MPSNPTVPRSPAPSFSKFVRRTATKVVGSSRMSPAMKNKQRRLSLRRSTYSTKESSSGDGSLSNMMDSCASLLDSSTTLIGYSYAEEADLSYEKATFHATKRNTPAMKHRDRRRSIPKLSGIRVNSRRDTSSQKSTPAMKSQQRGRSITKLKRVRVNSRSKIPSQRSTPAMKDQPRRRSIPQLKNIQEHPQRATPAMKSRQRRRSRSIPTLKASK